MFSSFLSYPPFDILWGIFFPTFFNLSETFNFVSLLLGKTLFVVQFPSTSGPVCKTSQKPFNEIFSTFRNVGV